MYRRVGFFVATMLLLVSLGISVSTTSFAATPVAAGLEIETIFDGYSSFDEPVAIEFASDNRVFVAEHDGRVQVFDDIYDGSPAELFDIRDRVHEFWDRGFLGIALDPDFESNPVLYGLYTWDINGWGSNCPNPPGGTNDGCVVNGRLSKWTVGSDNTVGPETILLEGYWCQQFPSHSVGDLAFAADGALYVSAGDGASFNGVDYGQHGGDEGSPTPANPCDDPPHGIGEDLTIPTAEGGALRSQDLLTPGDPLSYDGTILRVDPRTGNALASNPMYDSGQSAGNQPDEARIIAYGLRNPYRIATQPGADDLWIGDVGWSAWEELNRIESPTNNVVENFGWPCYEGGNGTSARQSAYDGLGIDLCEDLYAGVVGSGVTAPYWAYTRANAPGAPARCNSGTGSITGLDFVTADSYPSNFSGALLIGDYSIRCVWMMEADGSGDPNPASISVLIEDVGVVDLEFGPGSEVYVVDFDAGEVLRITHSAGNAAPVASLRASPLSGKTPLGVRLDASDSSDAEGDQLRFEWDLDDDGQFDDATGAIVDHIFSAVGSREVQVRATDFHGASDVNSLTLEVTPTDSDPPVLAEIADIVVDEFETAEFTADATDPDTASEALIFSLQEGPGSIDAETGYYLWTPGEPDEGLHTVTIRVTDDTDPPLFDQRTFRISVNELNLPPKATIADPSPDLKWKVGDEIAVSGFGTDPEEGSLAPSALDWDVSIHHCGTSDNCHVHNVASHVGDAWSFSAPDHEFQTWLTITLKVTDEAGATDSTSIDIFPETDLFHIRTEPARLRVVLGSGALPAPFSKEVLLGSQNEIIAVSPQIIDGTAYSFVRWDDGVTTFGRTELSSGTDRTFTAVFAEGFTIPPGGFRQDAVGLVDPTQGFWRLYAPVGVLYNSFFFGNPGDIPFVGDWNCNGIDTPGMYRQSDGFVYLRNSNSRGIADRRFFFGNPGDVPIAGDFNGDGCDTVSLYRPSETRFFIVNTLGENGGGLGAAEANYIFGNPGDRPFSGDFDGDGTDTVGLHRASTGLVYFRNSHTQGLADASFIFGDPGDIVVAGDWGIVDTVDSPAAYRSSNTVVYLRYVNNAGNAEFQYITGRAGDLPVAGRWG
jgi:glucose/arabinose dehydrogenase